MPVRGRKYATGGALSADDLHELVDLLAIRIYERLGESSFLLNRGDVGELVTPYIDDLIPSDQQDVIWLVWELIQAGAREREGR
ncbi:MAG: hypothetical protein ACK5C8_09920 [Roseiflexaceae bacterium]|jgi:hypothetical protein|nr:hypothetical protein [Chloroflexaceae bacterium]